MEYDAEFWGWDVEVREVFEERLAILCDGGPVTPAMDQIARVEARQAQAQAIARRAMPPVRFGG
jgi:hypothetical protein